VFLIPSKWECCCIAVAETLHRLLVVETPVESLRCLYIQGFSGTISATFNKDAILAILLQDAERWDREDNEHKTISAFW
jgi:hypothetical protein